MRVAIVAPSPALRAGLHTLIEYPPDAGAPQRIMLEAASPADFFAAEIEVDVLLLAGEELDEDGLRQALGEKEPRLGVLALSDRPEIAQALAGLPLAGWGVLPLDSSSEDLQAGLAAVAAGLCVVTPALFFNLQTRLSPLLNTALSGAHPPGDEALTERESQVLQHLALGLANKQIALALGISEHTVKFHVSSIYAKLHAGNRTEAVRAGVQRGLVIL